MRCPENPLSRLRIARALGFADAAALLLRLDGHRSVVAQAFAGLLQARRRKLEPTAIARYWQACPKAATPRCSPTPASPRPRPCTRACATSPDRRRCAALSERARQRLDHVLPALLEASAQGSAPDAALPRGLALLQAIARRTSYLALLDEQPAALARLVDVIARSSLLSERLAAHPLLLDELLDSRAAGALPDAADDPRASCRSGRGASCARCRSQPRGA